MFDRSWLTFLLRKMQLSRCLLVMINLRAMTTHYSLNRAPFIFELKLDEDSGRFTCSCSPPLEQTCAEDSLIRRYRSWVKQIGVGWSRRRNGCYGNKVTVQFDPGDAMRGIFVSAAQAESSGIR